MAKLSPKQLAHLQDLWKANEREAESASVERAAAKKHEASGNFSRADGAKKRARYHQDNADTLHASASKLGPRPKKASSRAERLMSGEEPKPKRIRMTPEANAANKAYSDKAVRAGVRGRAPVTNSLVKKEPTFAGEEAAIKKHGEAGAKKHFADKEKAAPKKKVKGKAKKEKTKKVPKKKAEKPKRGSVKVGKKGGKYYMTPAGKKVYVK